MNKSELPKNIEQWKQWLAGYQPDTTNYPDDALALECCKLALQAVASGNFGIGCILLDAGGKKVVEGHNQLFKPYFRSDAHGEMVVMDEFEEKNQQITSMKGYTLYTSLEPCPMCLARLITSGCQRVLYVAADRLGGIVHLSHSLPPVWLQLMNQRQPPQVFAAAECSPVLRQASHDILMLNAEELNERLISR